MSLLAGFSCQGETTYSRVIQLIPISNYFCVEASTGKASNDQALRFGTQGYGFEPCRFLKEFYMTLHGF